MTGINQINQANLDKLNEELRGIEYRLRREPANQELKNQQAELQRKISDIITGKVYEKADKDTDVPIIGFSIEKGK